jgi:HlyD family secretion protein
MKRLIPIVILLAAAVAAGFYFYPRFKTKPAPSNEIALSGNIEAHESLSSFKVAGRIVELPIDEGQQVKQDDLLARLEDSDIRQKVRIDEASVVVRQSNLALAQAGTRDQEVKALQQSVVDAQADLTLKKADSDRAQQLFSKDELSAQDRDRAVTAFKRSEAALIVAQQHLSQAEEGSRKEDIAIAQANLEQAKANLGLSRINSSYTTLRAPAAGIITVRQAELGEVIAPGTPVVSVADLDHIWLRSYIAETDLGRIHWGQDTTITTDTYPGKQYHGRIAFIAPNAEFTPKSVQTYKERVTLVYRIKIDVDNPNHELKPGMPADARLQLAPTQDTNQQPANSAK